MERAQALGHAVIGDRVAGVVDAGDAVVEHVAKVAVKAAGELAPERVRVGHPNPMPRRHRMERDAIERGQARQRIRLSWFGVGRRMVHQLRRRGHHGRRQPEPVFPSPEPR